VDSGNWLALGYDLLHHPLRSPTIVYPPVVPLVVTGAASLLGPLNGVAAVSAVSSLLPGAAVHLVLRQSNLRWEAAAFGGLILAGSATGEATAWGGIPQLISLGLLVLFVWALDRYLRSGHLHQALGTGLLFSLLLGTSHLVALAGVLSAVAIVGCHVLLLRERWQQPAWKLLVGGAILVALPCLALVPLYRQLLTGLDARSPTPDRAVVLLDSHNLVRNVDFLFRDFAVWWRFAITVSLVTPALLWRRRRTTLWILGSSLLFATAASAALTRQSRFLYILPVATVMTLALWVPELAATRGSSARGARGALPWALALVLAIQVVLGLNFFDLQRDYYGVLNPQTVAAISWLQSNTTPDATVAVTIGKHDQLIGWWIEALAHRKTLFASHLVWLNFEDERGRALKANAIFGPGFPSPATIDLARDDGAEYLFVVKAWDGYDRPAVARFRTEHPDAAVFDNPSVLILRPPRPPTTG